MRYYCVLTSINKTHNENLATRTRTALLRYCDSLHASQLYSYNELIIKIPEEQSFWGRQCRERYNRMIWAMSRILVLDVDLCSSNQTSCHRGVVDIASQRNNNQQWFVYYNTNIKIFNTRTKTDALLHLFNVTDRDRIFEETTPINIYCLHVITVLLFRPSNTKIVSECTTSSTPRTTAITVA